MNTDTDTSSEIAALRSQVFTLLVALIVVSGTLTVFLYRQSSLAGKDLVQAQQVSDNLLKNEAGVNTFVGQLVGYGQHNPDFMPVLKKYGLPPAAAPAAPAAPKK